VNNISDGTEYLFDKKRINKIKDEGMSYKKDKQNAANSNIKPHH